MSERRTLVLHTLIYGVGAMLSPIASLVLLPVYTNYLSSAEYGTLDLIYRTAAVINIVLMVGGIRTATLTFYKQAESDEERHRVAATISLFLWVMVGVAVLAATLLAEPLERFLRLGDPTLLAFGLTTALIEVLLAVPLTLMQARLESTRYVLWNLIITATRITLALVLVMRYDWGIWGFLASQYAVCLFFGIALTFSELRRSSFRPDFSKWLDMVRYCWPFIPGGLLYFVYCTADRFFLLHHSPYAMPEAALAAIGIYALAARFCEFIKVLGTTPLYQVWTSKMYDYYKRPDAEDLFGRFYLKMMIVFTFPALGLAVFSTELVRGLCSSDYLPAAALIPWLCVNATIMANLGPAECTYYITRKTIYKPWVNAAALVPLLLAMWLLVPRYGVNGVVASQLIGITFSLLVAVALTQRFFRIRYRYGKLALLFGLAIGCYLISRWCGEGIVPTALSPEEFETLTKWEKLFDALTRLQPIPLLLKSSCLFLWVALIWISGVLGKDDKEMIGQMLQRLVAISGRFFRRPPVS